SLAALRVEVAAAGDSCAFPAAGGRARPCVDGVRRAHREDRAPGLTARSGNDVALPERGHDALRRVFRRPRARVDDDLRTLWRLVGRVDAREVLDLALQGARVEPFRVALPADLERRIDVDLDELALGNELAHHAPLRAEGEMNEQSTMAPASTKRRATSPTRRMFSTRSASVKPRSRFNPWRTLSPSSM